MGNGKMIAIVGPTASGKTRRAVDIAHVFNGEVVSGDSRQVYRHMDLGTGKDLEEYGDIPYHLIDICEAGEKYNLYRYLDDFSRVKTDIESRGKRMVLCGGSGMYVEAALNGLLMPEVPRNEDLRARLEGCSLDELTAILSSMKTLHNVTDVDTAQRALRAIEIQTYYNEHPEERPETEDARNSKPDAVIVGIDISRDVRRQRITQRLRQRLDNGMVDEVRKLLNRGIDKESLIYYGLEYKWLTLFATGAIGYDEMFRQLETAIHQFAKRQMTWFRGMEKRGHEIKWVPFDIDPHELNSKIAEWIA